MKTSFLKTHPSHKSRSFSDRDGAILLSRQTYDLISTEDVLATFKQTDTGRYEGIIVLGERVLVTSADTFATPRRASAEMRKVVARTKLSHTLRGTPPSFESTSQYLAAVAA